MIADFADQGTEDIFDQVNSPAARRTCPQRLWPVARSKMDALNRAGELQDLAQPPGNRLEALRGGRQGQHSIRINDQYRLCFSWHYGQATAVEIADYHR